MYQCKYMFWRIYFHKGRKSQEATSNNRYFVLTHTIIICTEQFTISTTMLKNNNSDLIPPDLCFQLLSRQIQTCSKHENKIRICFIHGSCVRTSMAVLRTACSCKVPLKHLEFQDCIYKCIPKLA